MILNLINPTKGEILFNGKKIDSKVLDTFGYLPEEGSLLPEFTVLDICEYYGALKLMNKEEIHESLKKWLNEFGISEYFNMKVNKLSKGNRQKIQFIVSVLHNPDFIILDEPFSGLDPVSVEELEKAIMKLKNEGKTIIFSSHVMNHVENLCDDVLIINHGEALLYGNLKEILADYKIDGKNANSLNDIFIDEPVKFDPDYVLSFGRYSGRKLIDVYKKYPDYVDWMEENIYRKDVRTQIKAMKEELKNGED